MRVYVEKRFANVRLPAGAHVVTLAAARRGGIEAAVCGRAAAAQIAGWQLPGLRFIQLTSAGWDGIPLSELAGRGVRVANAAGVYSAPIAETVVLGLLLIAKKYRRNPNNRRAKLTRGYRLIGELAGKQVMILGAGSIGQAVARRLAGFEMEVLGYDLSATPRDGFARILAGREELKTALRASDFLVSTLPDVPGTRGLVDAGLIGCLPAGAVFVNVGRRAAVDEPALYRALKTGALGGAVLDMFEWLPNPLTNPFRRLRNVVVLPGVAAISRESRVRLLDLAARNLGNVARGEEPDHVINRAAGG